MRQRFRLFSLTKFKTLKEAWIIAHVLFNHLLQLCHSVCQGSVPKAVVPIVMKAGFHPILPQGLQEIHLMTKRVGALKPEQMP